MFTCHPLTMQCVCAVWAVVFMLWLKCRGGRITSDVLLLVWPWPNDLHVQTWPVLPGDVPNVQIWTSYVKAYDSYCLTDALNWPKLCTTPLRGWSAIFLRVLDAEQYFPDSFIYVHWISNLMCIRRNLIYTKQNERSKQKKQWLAGIMGRYSEGSLFKGSLTKT